jgi:hypothetical protein
MQGISFEVAEDVGASVQVSIMSLSGENMRVNVQDNVTLDSLKRAIVLKLGLTVYEDFHLAVIGSETLPDDSALVSHLPVSHDAMVCMSIVKVPITLRRYEEKSFEEWREVASQLESRDIDDDSMLICLRAFLDKYPALINWQPLCEGTTHYWPLLYYAVQSFDITSLRQQCVDELLKRGARVHIRHDAGFLLEHARQKGSAFVEYLSGKAQEFKAYEEKAILEWRAVSSKLCGETSAQVQDEEEMTRIVMQFCTGYPEMVNFQNNHACNASTDQPYGYFAYAPLMSFAGAQACRRRSGSSGETENVRRGAVQELLKHGARVHTHHGNKTSLDWMKAEGSLLTDWLETQLCSPMPPQMPFKFER